MISDIFTVFPAIDLLGGKCVRLKQGSYDDVTVYSDDPVKTALSFKEAGARAIHIVDLDAARSGVLVNSEIIAEISRQTGLYIQTGGGIRNMDILEKVLKAGVSRAILGTSAVRDRAFTAIALREYSCSVAVGIDARNGEVSVQGWTEDTGIKTLDFARLIEAEGARTIIFTDISRDGMLVGTQLDGIRELVAGTQMQIIASGGIGCIGDVIDAKEAGACGAIVGKAIYEGKVDLKKCLQSV
ncbi:MAG: 1-(5-phosphoribosyl)-5-[(5-phosphoribosylamino)methylideneamino]imidazole-4-carboxamide isomerase [Eubacteriales bacterium]|nr:1-(5-phosphoribosyl)-5-[(5-phosphoribosylamino)methylideneamino]imidazole-4-carboxamide isomerase [Eubacteriales bacterium]